MKKSEKQDKSKKKPKKKMKLQTKKNVVAIVIAALTIIFFLITFYIILRYFPQIVAISILQGYKDLFSGNFKATYFLFAGIIAACGFLYASTFFTLFRLLRAKQDYRKKLIPMLVDATRLVIKESKNTYYLILTITICISFMYSGALFLSTAFPNEPMFLADGLTTETGSNMKCHGSGFSNIIETYDIPCDIALAKKFENMDFEGVEMKYFINRTEHKENLSDARRNRITLNFYKEKQPTFIIFKFNESEEWFTINNKGVFTKEEYFEREKNKAMWFFAIISFSLFTVFSGMSSLKHIMRKE